MSNFETLGGASPRSTHAEMATKRCSICQFEVGHHPKCPKEK